MYMPTLARFSSRDPLPDDDKPILGSNPQAAYTAPYVYVSNAPTVMSDPSGLGPVPPVPRRKPGWPAANLGAGECGPKKKNAALWGIESLLCCPSEKGCLISHFGEDTISQRLPPGVTRPGGEPVGSGLGGGHHRFCGPLKAGTVVGTGGCGPSVCVVIYCADGTTLVGHFGNTQDPADTFAPYTFPDDCKALICGGNNSHPSNCTMNKLACLLDEKGVDVSISDTASCWVDSSGKHFISSVLDQASTNDPTLTKSCPPKYRVAGIIGALNPPPPSYSPC